MDGSEEFKTFLDYFIEDLYTAGWATNGSELPQNRLSSDITTSEQIGLGTILSTSPLGSIEAILDRVIQENGTIWIGNQRSAEYMTFMDINSSESIRRRALQIIGRTPQYRSQLRQVLVAGVPPDVLRAVFLMLIHGPRWGAIISRFNALELWYENTIAISVIISTKRLRRGEQEHALFRSLIRLIRQGRNRVSSALLLIAQDSKHFGYSHQAMVNSKLTDLTSLRFQWQKARLIAGLANITPPTPSERASYARLNQIIIRNRELTAGIAEAQIDRQKYRSISRDSDEPSDVRAEARSLLRIIWPEIRQMSSDREAIRAEIRQLNRQLDRQTRNRIERFLEAERQGIRRRDALNYRNNMFARLDRKISSLTNHRLQCGTEEEKWSTLILLLERLVKNNWNIGIELFMDSLLKIEQFVDKNRNIGIEAHSRGRVQWLTYPGHGDNAVDWNCASGLEILVSFPNNFKIPSRYLNDALSAEVFRYQSSQATSRINGSNDLQDIFGKIAYGLLGRAGSRQESLALILQNNYESEIAPAVIRTRNFSGGDITRLLTGLLARNLTPIDNALEFNTLRTSILLLIEQAVVRRMTGVPVSMVLFNRSRIHANSGSFGIGRIVVNIRMGELLRHVSELLSSNSTSAYGAERNRIINRLWRLLVLMRSAGAELHRRAASVYIRHFYRSNSNKELQIEIYYTHLHRINISPNSQLALGDVIGLTGSTGNAVNTHVHIEIELKNNSFDIGTVLPHEFFPLGA